MCGHLGIISTKKLDDKMVEAYATMMQLSVPRGKDSAGTLAIERKKDGLYFAVRKKAQHPYDYLRDQATKTFLSSTNHALLGHVRWATIGGVTEGTAHPYHIRPKKDEHEELIGFHNGTIRSYKEGADLTDSERFYKRVSELGFREALEELPKDSAYAFVYFSIQDGDFTFFRNDRRELFMAASKDNTTLIYASEKRFITAALSYAECLDEFHEPGALPRNTLLRLRYDGDKIKLLATTDFLPEETIKKHEEVTAKTGGFHEAGAYSSCSYGNNLRVTNGRSTTSSDASGTSMPPPSSGNVLNFHRFKKGKIQGPFPSVRYKYDPTTQRLHREIYRTANNSQSITFWPANPQYKHEFEQMRKLCIIERGGCWMELDESTWDFIVFLPTGKTRTIKCTDDRWEGWWKVWEYLDNEWANQADRDKALRKAEVDMTTLLFDFNQLHSMASRFTTSNPKEVKEVKSDQELSVSASREDDDPIPFEENEEDLSYLGYRYDEWNLEEANFKLGKGCMNCFEHSTVNDLVYWVNDSNYVCEPCAEMVATHLGADMMNSTIGRMKSNNILSRLN